MPKTAKRQSSKQAAFTLIELLVCIAIFGMLTVAIAQFLTSFLMMKFNAETLQRIRSDGNYVLDRVEFLVRNGVTIPEVCIGPATTPGVSSGSMELKTNTSDLSQKRQRSMIARREEMGPSGTNYGYLLLWQIGEVDDPSVRHSSGYFDNDDKGIKLTSTQTGLVGTAPFNVTGFNVTCERDQFTNGLVVTTSFKISYDRRTLGQDSPSIEESFIRQTAVRNAKPWDN